MRQRQVELSFRALQATGRYTAGELNLGPMVEEVDELVLELALGDVAMSDCRTVLERIRTEHPEKLHARITERDQVLGQLVNGVRGILRMYLRSLDRTA